MTGLPSDIIFFAVLAVFLLVQFNSILGKGHEEEFKKPEVKESDLEKIKQETIAEVKKKLPNINEVNKDTNIMEVAEEIITSTVSKAEEKHKEDLKAFAEDYKGFDLNTFIKGAITAFGMIVLGYARGNLAVLKNMLDDDLFEVFKEEISKRKKGEVIDTKIEKLNKLEILETKLKGTMAYIKLKFVSEQTTAIRDEDGKVLKGDPEQTREITDVWTFSRDIRSDKPTWTLISSEA